MTIIVSTTAASTSTAQQIVNRALRLIGELASGDSPSDDEGADALQALNALIGDWSNDSLMCYAVRDETLTLATSQASYTLGPSGDLDTTRPEVIEGCYVVVSGVSYPVQVLETPQQYAAVKVKAQAGDWPLKVYYEPDVPLGTLFCYPVPNGAVEMHLLTKTPLTFYSLADTVEMPPGWDNALAFNLAIALAPEYETQPSQYVVLTARNSRRGIRNVNAIPVLAKPAFAGFRMQQQRPNILADGE